MKFAISQPKVVRLPRNGKQTYWFNSRPQMWPSGLTLAMILTLNFQGQIYDLLYLSQKWSDCHETKSKMSIELKASNASIRFTLAMTLTFNFQGQIWNLLYLSQKWSDCHKTKSKHINWTHQWSQMWPVGLTLTMTLTLNFEGQMWPWPLTTHMTLTIDFHGQILK